MSGEVNTATNLGVGVGIFETKSGTDLRFKSLNAGTNISIAPGSETITIATTAEANAAQNIGSGERVFESKSGSTLRFRTLTAGSRISLGSTADEIFINCLAELNHAENYGIEGIGIFKDKLGSTLRFRPLIAGDNITISTDGNTISIASTDPGEINTASNLAGEGEVIFAGKTGTNFDFKTINAGPNISLSSTSTNVTIDATHSLANHTDVNLDPSPIIGTTLTYNGTSWVSQPPVYVQYSVTGNTTMENGSVAIPAGFPMKLKAFSSNFSLAESFTHSPPNRTNYTGSFSFIGRIAFTVSMYPGDNDRSFYFFIRKNEVETLTPSKFLVVAHNAIQGAGNGSASFLTTIAPGDYFEIWTENASSFATTLTITELHLNIQLVRRL
jgi:hypothetical protein